MFCCTLLPERLGLVRRDPSLEGSDDEDGEPCPKVETPLTTEKEGNAENEAGDLEEEGLSKVHGHFSSSVSLFGSLSLFTLCGD